MLTALSQTAVVVRTMKLHWKVRLVEIFGVLLLLAVPIDVDAEDGEMSLIIVASWRLCCRSCTFRQQSPPMRPLRARDEVVSKVFHTQVRFCR